ncbi:unnamed protein product [Cunninghamella blakesleeana]
MFKSKKKGENKFTTASNRQKSRLDHHNPIIESEYPFRLNFYHKPPPSEITIEEFELFALIDFKFLKQLKQLNFVI